MIYRNIHQYIFIAALCMLAFTGSALGRGLPEEVSEQAPAYYPSSFQKTGILREVSANQVTIDGIRYTLSSNLLVHELRTQHSSRFALREGLELGFSYANDSHNAGTITEIWILPQGSVRPN